MIGARPAPADAYKYYAEYSTDSAATTAGETTWQPIHEIDLRTNTKDRPHAYFELATPLTGVKQLRVTNVHMPANSSFSLSGFRVFGDGGGSAPALVAAGTVVATRNATDARRVQVSWAASAGSDFYIVRYGVVDPNSNRLPYNYQIYDGTDADIRALVAGVKYTFVVDAVNENGVTVGKSTNVVA